MEQIISSQISSHLIITCAQVFSHKVGFSAAYLMQAGSGDTIGKSYKYFCHDYGVPEHRNFDGSIAQVGKNTLFMKTINKYGTGYHDSSPRIPNENLLEGAISEIKKRWYRIMLKNKVTKILWDYGLIWIRETGNLSVSSSRYASDRTPLEYITVDTPDIIEYLYFTFYYWITYRTNYGLGEMSIGRWLGVSHKVGHMIYYWVITVSGNVISFVTVQRLTNPERNTDEWSHRMREYHIAIEQKLDIKDADLSKDLVMVELWNKLTVADKDREFLDEYNSLISDGSISNGKEDNKIDDKEK